MKALLITPENLSWVKTTFEFKVIPIEADGDSGTYVHHYEDESDDIVGKYLVDDWEEHSNKWGTVDAGVFAFAFDIVDTEPYSEWLTIEHKHD